MNDDFIKIMTKLNDVPFNPWIERDNGSKVYWEAHINYKGRWHRVKRWFYEGVTQYEHEADVHIDDLPADLFDVYNLRGEWLGGVETIF